MRKPKRIIIFALLILMTAVPCFANMPVIDVTAIATAVSNFSRQIEQWKTTLKQYKSEFDRIEKAAKGLTSGDFTKFVSSLGDLTGQMASWNIAKTLGATDYDNLDQILENTSNGSYSLLNLMSSTSMFLRYYDLFVDGMENNAFIKQMRENEKIGGSDEAGGGLGTAAATTSSVLETFDNMGTLIKQMVLNGENILTAGADMWNNWADIVNVTPDEYAKILTEIHEDTLSSMYSVATTKEMEDKVTALKQEWAQKKSSLSTMNSETNKEQYEKQKMLVEQAWADYEEAETILAWSQKMDSAIAEVKGQQESYEDSNTWKEKKEAQAQAELLMKEYADTIDLEAATGKTWEALYDEYHIDNSVGTTHEIEDRKYYK